MQQGISGLPLITSLFQHNKLCLALILFTLLLTLFKCCNAETLPQLLLIARQNDNQYKASKHQYNAALARLDQAKSTFYPTFNFTANDNMNDQEIKFIGTSTQTRNQKFNTYGYSFQINQPIYKRINIVNLDQSEAQVAQAQAQITQAEVDLVNRLAQAFYESIQAASNLAFAHSQRELAQAQSEALNHKFEQESATIHEKYEANAKLNISIAQELDASIELNNKLYALNQITGLNLTATNLSLEEVNLVKKLQPIDFWLELGKTENPTVLVQQSTRAIAKLEIDKAKSGHYPSLDLVANYGENRQGPTAAFASETVVTSGSIGIQMNIPIYAGGMVNAKTNEAVSLLEKAEEDIESAKKQALMSVYQAHSTIISNQAQLSAYQELADTYKESLLATIKAVQIGTKTPVDELTARQQLTSIQRDAIKAETNLLLSYIRLRSAVGYLDLNQKK